MTSASSMHSAGHSKLVLWDNPEGCDGEGGERGASGRKDNHAPMADSCRGMAETTTIL